MSDRNNTIDLQEKDWSDALKREVSRIRHWPAVDSSSLYVITDEKGRIRLGFNLQTERLLEPSATKILEIEPLNFVYTALDTVGLYAPAVWSDRPDFPRDIGHINPTPPESPASICLARSGLQPVYDRYGIDGVLQRLIDWFHDAKTGQLMKNGWEPVPMGEGQEIQGGYFNIGFFQELAFNHNEGVGWCFGLARLLKEGLPGRVVFLSQTYDLNVPEQVQAFSETIKPLPKEQGVAAYIPWIFVWSDRVHPIDRQLFGVWNSYGEIEEGLKGTGVENHLPTVIVDALLRVDREKTNNRPVALLIGIWRPQPISAEVFGMAANTDARRLEIRAYLIRCEKNKVNPVDHAIPVEQLFGLQLLTREMLEFTSGVSVTASIALFGYGALGSCIADFLLRIGIPKIMAVDNDALQPHNLARHIGTNRDLYEAKVRHLDIHAGALSFFQDEILRKSQNSNILQMSNESFEEISQEYPLIIDTTADERVRRMLAKNTLPAVTRLLRAEIFHNGRLGVLFVTGTGNNPNAIDLYYELCLRGIEEKAIECWLREEQAAGIDSEELVLGMGCASATTRMPKYLVAQHATSFMPKIIGIVKNNTNAGIGINPLANDGVPQGWRWFDYGGDVTVLRPADSFDWDVRLSPSANNELERLRQTHGEIETGGYLYGGYDFVLKQVYVVAVSDVPPGTTQSETAILLGPAGQTRFERQIERSTGGKLGLVGTWHSHPHSGPSMSVKDRSTMERFVERDRENGVPTLLLISSPEGNAAHMWT